MAACMRTIGSADRVGIESKQGHGMGSKVSCSPPPTPIHACTPIERKQHIGPRLSLPHVQLVTASLERFMGKLSLSARGNRSGGGKEGGSEAPTRTMQDMEDTCFITHASRADIIQGLLGHRALVDSFERRMSIPAFGGGLVIAGSDEHRLEPFVEQYIGMAKMPVLRSYLPTTDTLATIKKLTPKMQADDEERIRQVIELYSPFLDDAITRIVGGPDINTSPK
eukprot:CAMPEP_0181186340 /NCGR_PEP_ID=MMETSP1096-20121128/9982_1 /TAXON_ID=156174 ORGANISM="Chrysochromulina ericina, Strain CCMP281" /NCGR_SAMPLE_ID=MMETSP1096 /ASSEMBLY_ACC=CAM_ASM_000453 /LENGTH=223 /DNA_ID=CAMNT_0023275231 /DNA_START=119 /DNA_END=790 /DNA_ORIENTATION=+